MPFLPEEDKPSYSLDALPQFPDEQQQKEQPHPGIPAVVRAAMEEYWPTTKLSQNIAGMFGPQTPVEEQPGFDPISAVPPRHLDRVKEYLHLDNPAQVAAKTAELDHKDANHGIIARGGALGTAVGMAGGIIDPLNVAAMAIVPEAAPTRVGNAIRWGLTNAAVTAGQELVNSGLGEDTNLKGSMLNIGASAVLGGVLGSIARRIPKAELDKVIEDAGKDLRAPPPPEAEVNPVVTPSSQVAGGPKTVIETAERQIDAEMRGAEEAGYKGSFAEAMDGETARQEREAAAFRRSQYTSAETAGGYRVGGEFVHPETGDRGVIRSIHQFGPGEPWNARVSFPPSEKGAGFNESFELPGQPKEGEESRPALMYVPPRPEGPKVPAFGPMPDVDPQRMSLTEALAVSRGKDAKSGGLSSVEAVQQGLDPEYVKTARFGKAKVFTKGGMSFDEAAQMMQEHGYPVVDEQGRYTPNDLLNALDEESRGKKQYSTAADDYLQRVAEHERASEKADRIAAGERVEEPEVKPTKPPAEEKVPEEATEFEPEKLEKELTEAQEKAVSEQKAQNRALPGEQEADEVYDERFTSLVRENLERRLEASKRLREEAQASGLPEADVKELVEGHEADIAQLEQELKDLPEPETPMGELPAVNPNPESTSGAMQVRGLTLEDTATARGGNLYSKTVGKVAPAARLMQSASTKVRQLAMDLMNIPGTLAMHYRDLASPDPIERQLWKELEARLAEGISQTKQGYAAYRERIAGTAEKPVSFRQFRELVAPAMRRNDQSGIPEVARLAQWMREKGGFDEFFRRAEKAGMLKGQETQALYAESYMTRLYDQQKIAANRSGWLSVIEQWAMRNGVDRAEATGIAHDVDRRIGGSERGTMDSKAFDNIVAKSGRLKARTLPIPDKELEPFLVNDISALHSHYLRTMVPEVLMTERFGTRDLADQLLGIRDDYARLIEQARATGDNERMGLLGKARDTDIKTLEAARDIMYGNYGVPKDPGKWYIRAGRMLRQVNVSRMLGGATFKHFPDVANLIMRYGADNTFSVMGKLATSLDAAKLAYSDAKRFGVATDMITNVTSGALWDSASHSQFPEQRFMRSFNKFFTTITGETPLITMIQSLASKASEEEILKMARWVNEGRSIPKNRAAVLAAGNLNTGMLQRIAQQDALKGQTINGLRFGNSETWADKEAARALESAIARDAHGITMRPGVGDRPLFMNTEMGKFLFQFKSFEFAASRIIGLPMLQGMAHGDMRAAQGLMAQFAMATAGYVLYQKAIGQKVETDPKRLAVEILDRTNFMGWTSSALFPAIHQLGFKDFSRWYDKDPVSQLGPSAEMAYELMNRNLPGRVAQGIFGKAPGQQNLPFRRSDLHFMRKLMPYNQLWYLRSTLDNLEDAVGDGFNLPGKSLADYRAERQRGETLQ